MRRTFQVLFGTLLLILLGSDEAVALLSPHHGGYGDLQGTGGIDAVVNDSTSVATGVISDIYGHTEATVSGTTTTWNPTRSVGYGTEPGSSTPLPLDGTHDLSSFLSWRGKYVDPTGFYYLGSRYYDPTSGTFLSCDPLGHAASMDLYSYCAGDPVNNFDPDGRVTSNYANNTGAGPDNNSLANGAHSVGDFLYNLLPNESDFTNLESDIPQAWNEVSQIFASPLTTLPNAFESAPGRMANGLESFDAASSTPQGRSDITLGALALASGKVGSINALTQTAFRARLFSLGTNGTGDLSYMQRMGAMRQASAGSINLPNWIVTGIPLQAQPAAEGESSAIPESYMNSNHLVDMEPARDLPGSTLNASGQVRNADYFWNQLITREPQMFSNGNLYRIQELGLSPRVDATWVESNPTHQSFMGDVLAHHHVDQGPIAVPLPTTVHQQWTSALHGN